MTTNHRPLLTAGSCSLVEADASAVAAEIRASGVDTQATEAAVRRLLSLGARGHGAVRTAMYRMGTAFFDGSESIDQANQAWREMEARIGAEVLAESLPKMACYGEMCLQVLAAPPPPVEPPPAEASPDALAAYVDQRYPDLDLTALLGEGPQPVPWLMEPFIVRGEVVALHSKPKTGKSLLALEVAAALATGRSCFGNEPGEPVHVLYIDRENTTGNIRERLLDLGYDKADDVSRLHYQRFPVTGYLDTPAGGQEVLKMARRHGVALVILDTVSRVVEGPEDKSDTFRALYQCTIDPLKAAGMAVLRLDHSGKDEGRGQRGSSAKNDDVDMVWELKRRSHWDFTLTKTHDRGGHGADLLALKRQTGPLRHTLVSSSESGPAGVDGRERILELVAQLDALGIPADAGREAIKAAGVRARNTVIAQVIEERRKGPQTDGWTPSSVLGSGAS